MSARPRPTVLPGDDPDGDGIDEAPQRAELAQNRNPVKDPKEDVLLQIVEVVRRAEGRRRTPCTIDPNCSRLRACAQGLAGHDGSGERNVRRFWPRLIRCRCRRPVSPDGPTIAHGKFQGNFQEVEEVTR